MCHNFISQTWLLVKILCNWYFGNLLIIFLKFFKLFLLLILLHISLALPPPPCSPPAPRPRPSSSLTINHCCLYIWVMHICSLVTFFTFFHLVPTLPLPLITVCLFHWRYFFFLKTDWLKETICWLPFSWFWGRMHF